MKKTVYVDSDLEEMFCYAMRYAMGRMSYAPESVIRYLRPLLPHIRKAELQIWARDIEQQYMPEEELLTGKPEGSLEDYFRKLWLHFLKDIREELKRRDENG